MCAGTRSKGLKTRSCEAGFKLFYHGVQYIGIEGVILKDEYVNSLVEVKKVSDHEFKTGNQRGDFECCQCACPTNWMSVRRERGFLE